MAELAVYDNDPTLYLFTSLTAGSSHIITATSRIETILKANKIPFKGVDTATDELARKLYGRRASGKKLPLLVKEGFVVGDLEQVEEWNEYGELKDVLGVAASPAPAKPAPTQAASTVSKPTPKENVPPASIAASSEQNLAIRQLGAEAAKVAATKKAVPGKISTTNPLLSEKVNSPSASTPTKGKADTSGVLSPRNIPLPDTPKPDLGANDKKIPDAPKLADLQKPVKQPPSMLRDDADPALNAGPIATTHKLPTRANAQEPSSQQFHGSNVRTASQEEIKKIESEQSIPEVSSSEEEDDSGEDEDEDDEDKDLDTKPIVTGAGATKANVVPKTGSANVVSTRVSKVGSGEDDDDVDDDDEDEESDESATKTQAQHPKAAEKAGESVKD